MSSGVEREIKLSADAGYLLPDLSDLTAGVVEELGAGAPGVDVLGQR